MGLKNNTVHLESNYKLWIKMFEEEKEILNKIFTQDNFSIEHVGSTSIKDLKAKPIVDIAIGINNLKDFIKYEKNLEKIYTIKKNENNKEILLIKENEIETFFLIHVLKKNSERYKNMIKFRNILNNNTHILKEYENLKKKLSEKYPNNRKEYTKLKNTFIQTILKNNNNENINMKGEITNA